MWRRTRIWGSRVVEAPTQTVARALEALELLEQRVRGYESETRLQRFEPSAEQMAFLVHPSVEKALYGANQSGKTHSGRYLTAYHITGWYPDWFPKCNRIMDGVTRGRNFNIRMAGESYEAAINQTMVPPLLDLIPKDLGYQLRKNNVGHFTGIRFDNGVNVQCMSFSQEIKKWEGWVGHYSWMDEPPPEGHYIASLRGLQRYDGQMVLTLTPLNCAWIDRRFMRAAEHAKPGTPERMIPHVVYLPLSSNKWIPEERKRHWAAALELSGEAEMKARLYGVPMSSMGYVYPQFSLEKHRIPTFLLDPKEWNVVHCLDPHDRKPNAQVWVALSRPDEKGRSRKIVIHEDFDQRFTIKQNAQYIQGVETDQLGNYFIGGKAPKVYLRRIDPNFGPKLYGNSGLTCIQEYANEGHAIGYPLGFQTADDNVPMGHSAVRSWLLGTVTWPLLVEGVPPETQNRKEVPEFGVLPHCKHTLEGFRYYGFDEKQSSEKVKDDRYKDMMDLQRYLACQGLTWYDYDGEAERFRAEEARRAEFPDSIDLDGHDFDLEG